MSTVPLEEYLRVSDELEAMRDVVESVRALAARPVLSRDELKSHLLGEPYRLAHILCNSEHPEVAQNMTGFAGPGGFYVSCATHKMKANQIAESIIHVVRDTGEVH